MEHVNKKMEDLQHEIENSLRSCIMNTSIAVMQWNSGYSYKDCETLGDLRNKLFEEYGLTIK